LLAVLSAKAQTSDNPLSLKAAIEYGLAHNRTVEKGGLDVEKDKYKMKEAMSGYLPQARGSITVIDNLKLQTSILPGEIFGQPGTSIPVKFGTQYNVTAGIDVSQTIFDASQLMALKAVKEAKSLTALNQVKTKEQIIYDIASVYYAAQVTAIQKEIVLNNLEKIDSLIEITKVQYEFGFAKKIDNDRLIIIRTNIQTEIKNIETNYDQQLLLLKLYMSMPLDEEIVLSAEKYTFDGTIEAKQTSDFSGHTDIKILSIQQELQELNLKQLNAGYLPTL